MTCGELQAIPWLALVCVAHYWNVEPKETFTPDPIGCGSAFRKEELGVWRKRNRKDERNRKTGRLGVSVQTFKRKSTKRSATTIIVGDVTVMKDVTNVIQVRFQPCSSYIFSIIRQNIILIFPAALPRKIVPNNLVTANIYEWKRQQNLGYIALSLFTERMPLSCS